MNMCITVDGQLPAWVWLLIGLAMLLTVGIWLTALMEGLAERRSRMLKVRGGCAVRIDPHSGAVARAGRSPSAHWNLSSQVFLLMVWLGSWA